MLKISGKIINKIDKDSYKDKDGNIVEQVDLVVMADGDRTHQVVSCNPEQVKTLKLYDKVEFSVTSFQGVTKNNSAYVLYRLNEVLKA